MRPVLVALCLLASLAGWPVAAEQYPAKTVRIIVPTTAGGSTTDLLARLLANQSGWKVIVDNRAGAGGNLGTELVAHASPDGYTLAFVSSGNIVMNPFVYKNMSFDPLTDLRGIGPIGEAPQLLLVNAKLPVRTLQEFIAYAKARPGQLNYASPGIGTTVHLAGDQFARLAGIKLVHVPYKGTAAAAQDLAGGAVDMMSISLGPVTPFVQSGAVRVLAAAAPKRIAGLPDVPTSAEAGLPGYEMSTWFGLFAPRGTPSDVIEAWSAAITRLLDDPAAQRRLAENSVEPLRMGPADFARFIATDAEKWHRIVDESGIQPQ